MGFIVAEKEICEAGSNSLRLIENPRLNVVLLVNYGIRVGVAVLM